MTPYPYFRRFFAFLRRKMENLLFCETLAKTMTPYPWYFLDLSPAVMDIRGHKDRQSFKFEEFLGADPGGYGHKGT